MKHYENSLGKGRDAILQVFREGNELYRAGEMDQ